MTGGLRRAWLLLPALALVACEALPARPEARLAAASRRSPAELSVLLPEDPAGFRRGATTPSSRGEGGRETGYRTAGRTAAGATVEIYRLADTILPEGIGSPAAAEAFEQLVQEATRPLPQRRLQDQGRFTLPGTGPALLRCAETAGVYGREGVQGVLCAGGVAGGLLRLRVTMPRQDPMPADARAFAEAIIAALRTP